MSGQPSSRGWWCRGIYACLRGASMKIAVTFILSSVLVLLTTEESLTDFEEIKRFLKKI